MRLGKRIRREQEAYHAPLSIRIQQPGGTERSYKLRSELIATPLGTCGGAGQLGGTAGPWKESYEASGTIAPDASCPGLLLVSLQGGGTATHVGRYAITNSHCLNPSTGAFTNGVFVKTAANGNQLFGTYVGNSTVIQVPQPVGIFGITGTLSFSGGTGRFAGATGTVTMNGTLRADFSQPGAPIPTDARLVMIGEISSPGSAEH